MHSGTAGKPAPDDITAALVALAGACSFAAFSCGWMETGALAEQEKPNEQDQARRKKPPVATAAKTKTKTRTRTKAEATVTAEAAVTTTTGAIKAYGKRVREKLVPLFKTFDVPYPPGEMTWICLKQEKQLLVFASDKSARQRLVLSYPIIGASGATGPKLKEGDKQVPEGFYNIAGFRPNVIAHLGLAVDYPNSEDVLHAREEHRKNLGKDILIHGSRWSTGCLAMGNEPIEELFVLAHDTGCSKIKLIFAPCNLILSKPAIDFKYQPSWLPELYARIRCELQNYPIR